MDCEHFQSLEICGIEALRVGLWLWLEAQTDSCGNDRTEGRLQSSTMIDRRHLSLEDIAIVCPSSSAPKTGVSHTGRNGSMDIKIGNGNSRKIHLTIFNFVSIWNKHGSRMESHILQEFQQNPIVTDSSFGLVGFATHSGSQKESIVSFIRQHFIFRGQFGWIFIRRTIVVLGHALNILGLFPFRDAAFHILHGQIHEFTDFGFPQFDPPSSTFFGH
mmetsp:Transcript_41404/g.99739  ORF Transcript_41404/g.99739 Transcript_41404/m.99739 type:complete len:217 (-) Transcript_41404:997-1647(-)